MAVRSALPGSGEVDGGARREGLRVGASGLRDRRRAEREARGSAPPQDDMIQMSLDMPRVASRPDWRPEPLPDLSHVDAVAIDCETRGLKWWSGDILLGFAVGWREDDKYRSQYVPLRHAGQNHDVEATRRWFRKQIRDKHVTNVKTSFDNHVITSWGENFEAQGCTLGDVSHYAALLDDHRKRFSLEVLSQAYLGEG